MPTSLLWQRQLRLDQLWDGSPCSDPPTKLRFECTRSELHIEVDAPFLDDLPPPTPSGSTPELWNYEVVELFILGANDRYLEIELGPHGHYLLLELRGVRNMVRQGSSMRYETELSLPAGETGPSAVALPRWRGRAQLAAELLPPEPRAFNAFAIRGTAAERRYLAYSPCPGERPDFHQLQHFAPLFSAASR